MTRKPEYFAAMLDNLGEHARLYMAFDPNDTPIAGTLAIHYGDKVWYLYGASSNEHRNLMPNYLLQWRMIQWAVETNCRIYDFRGVSGDVSEDNPLYGLFRFKQGSAAVLPSLSARWILSSPLLSIGRSSTARPSSRNCANRSTSFATVENKGEHA